MKNSISHYISEIETRFGSQTKIIDLSTTGRIVAEYSFIIDSQRNRINQESKVKKDLEDMFEFLRMTYPFIGTKPFWCKIQKDDEELSQIIGAGFMERFSNWFDFVTIYLMNDRTEEDGDSKFIIFDLNFSWAISLDLFIKENRISIQKHVFQEVES